MTAVATSEIQKGCPCRTRTLDSDSKARRKHRASRGVSRGLACSMTVQKRVR